MRPLFLFSIALVLSITGRAQCNDNAFYPALIFQLGSGPSVSIQGGIQGQRTPFSVFAGVRSFADEAAKDAPAKYGFEPFAEVNWRLYSGEVTRYYVYVTGGPRSAGGGLAFNLVTGPSFGLRAKVGYEQRPCVSAGFIILFSAK